MASNDDRIPWESTARKHLRRQLLRDLERVEETTRALAGTIDDGEEVTPAEIQDVRVALAALQATVEEDVTTVAPDGDAYPRAVFAHVPNGALADHLERVTGRDAVAVVDDVANNREETTDE